MVKVLFVCLGNICRSPLAEAIFNHRTSQKCLSELFYADSCGTSDYNLGAMPDPRTQRNARKCGIVMTHRARQLVRSDLERFEHVLVMDTYNLHDTISHSDSHHHAKIKLIRTFDPLGQGDVPDPYHGTAQDFQLVFDILDRCIEGFITSLENQQRKPTL